jgi:hypothetical protein
MSQDHRSTATEEYTVPSEADPHVCEYCGAPFATEQHLALHWEQTHPEALTDEQRAAADDAGEDERQEIRLFRLKALGLLVLLYFGLMMAYALFT